MLYIYNMKKESIMKKSQKMRGLIAMIAVALFIDFIDPDCVCDWIVFLKFLSCCDQRLVKSCVL